MNDDEGSIIRMIRIGVDGYFIKWYSEEVLTAIEQLFTTDEKGNNQPSISHYPGGRDIVERFHDYNYDDRVVEVWESLTEREKFMLRLCCSDLTNREIARELKWDVSSLINFRTAVFKKWGMKSRIEVLLLVKKYNLFEL